MIKSFVPRFFYFFAALTLLVLFSIEISPSKHWAFAIIPLFIPIFLLANLIFCLVFIIDKNLVCAVISLVLILLGGKFIGRTFQFSTYNKTEIEHSRSLKILSYNVRVFNNYDHLSDEGKAAKSIINYTKNYPADIKCIQEFYHRSPSKEKGMYNTIQGLKVQNPYYYLKPSAIILGQYFGLAIFSKYRIISKGEVKFPIATSNQAIFADIVIKKDTIRVYNVHLQSMSINEEKLPSGIYSPENKSRGKTLIHKITRGAQLRSGQLKALLNHAATSPYKSIICGDLNDTPYSYTYEELSEDFNNAFEEEGNGFGFTYNGKLSLLRIDNIFTDKRLKVLSFKVLNKISYSDHFPIEAQIAY